MIVVKLVSMDRAAQLPNYRIHSAAEVAATFEEIRRNTKRRWHEVWFCASSVGRDTYSVGGRFIPAVDRSYHGDLVEQVWHTSPRLIDQLNRLAPFPYVRAERPVGDLAFAIRDVHIPTGYPLTEARLRAEYVQTLLEIYRRRESWEMFVRFLLLRNVKFVSLEYKVSNGKFSFIDWDTDNDSLIV